MVSKASSPLLRLAEVGEATPTIQNSLDNLLLCIYANRTCARELRSRFSRDSPTRRYSVEKALLTCPYAFPFS